MNYIDIAITIPLIWGAYKGFTKGLIIELASVIALILGGYVGMHFSGITSKYLNQVVTIEESFMPIVSFTVTFIVVVLVFYLLAKILEKIINLVALKLINKISGSIFGVAKAAFIVSLILVLIESVDQKLELISKETKENSVLYAPIGAIAPAIIPAVKELDLLKEAVDNVPEIIEATL
ncbi:MAG: CvpA family protein [Flavobacteriales bacterium]|nr:CvpA family protein [Flavobacteriales bacterium]